ncbi:hypothetical protein BDN72DRAFT_883209 [Pluteus cervinus]|uniref:Uncharacterized protein n=1 Tax=Pluteus cervinus TaxID=181527 RepID=A0ACD3A6L6_9AGAR|nr:hypothetical protein BDN72DRAFT_883209 [Pluteus cervinus]
MDLSSLTKEECFAKLDLEISYLEKRLGALRNLRNSLPPIASLPNEILSKIFLISHNLTIEEDPSGVVLEPQGWRGNTRLTLTWVSQHWRQVSLSYPDLWTFVTNGHMEYIRTCLDRSKGHELTAVLFAPLEKHTRACLSAMHRIRSLSVNVYDTPDREAVDPDYVWERQSAPCLVCLSMVSIDILGQEGDAGTRFFSGVHPHLQHLTLSGCEYHWNSPLLSVSTLTTFRIIDPHTHLRVRDLMEYLRMMPSLVDCQIETELEGAANPPHLEVSQQLYLPNLRTLTLQQKPMANVLSLLSQLNIPNSSITTESYVNSEEELSHVFQLLEEYWSQTPYWRDEIIRHISVRRTKYANLVCISMEMPVEKDVRQFAMNLQSYSLGHSVLLNISRHFSSRRCQPRSVSLTCVPREAVYTFASLLSLRVLRLEKIEGLGDQDSMDCGPDNFFPQLKELEVDGKRYHSFREYFGSLEDVDSRSE